MYTHIHTQHTHAVCVTCMCVVTHIHTCTHAYILVHIHTHTNTYIHTKNFHPKSVSLYRFYPGHLFCDRPHSSVMEDEVLSIKPLLSETYASRSFKVYPLHINNIHMYSWFMGYCSYHRDFCKGALSVLHSTNYNLSNTKLHIEYFTHHSR